MRSLVVLALVLGACDQPEIATAPSAQSADAKPAVDAEPAANGVSPALLVGRWGDNGDCTKDIVFNGDGTFRSHTGGVGTWSLDNDVMTMSGAGGAFQVRVQILNGQQLLIQNPDGSFGTSQRC